MTDRPDHDPARPDRVGGFNADGNGAASSGTPPTADSPAGWEETRAFSPTPEPRPQWTGGTAWGDPAGDRTQWAQPTARPETVAVAPRQRRASPFGQVLLAALLAAVLASGGTFLALNASGALNHGGTLAATTTAGNTVGARQPVTLDESSAIIDVAAKVSPAVVRITAEGATTGAGGTIPQTGIGSGVIYDANGWILTNRHVVTNDTGTVASKLTVELKDGRQFDGRAYGIDTLTDLAIVKIEATGLPAAPIGDSGELKVGQLTVAIGSPLGTYSNSVTSGIVSAKGRSITVNNGQQLSNLIQTDAAINPGNSGGPLLDAGGNVIGINTAIASNSNGIGFAIPINIARPIMQQALAGQKLTRPYIGIRYEAIDVQLQTTDKLPVDKGAIVRGGQATNGQTNAAVVPNSPADKAGIKEGDIIVSVEGQAIDSEHPLDAILSQFAPGQTVKVTILRGGKQQDLSVTLSTRPSGL
jgi:serine protease Do